MILKNSSVRSKMLKPSPKRSLFGPPHLTRNSKQELETSRFFPLAFFPVPASILTACEGDVVDWISVRKRITSHPRKTRAQRRVRFHPFAALNYENSNL